MVLCDVKDERSIIFVRDFGGMQGSMLYDIRVCVNIVKGMCII